MAKVTGQMIGKEVCEALNLGSGVRSVEIRIATSEAVALTVERMVGDHEAKALLKVLSKYHLTEAETTKEAACVDEVNGIEEDFVRHQRAPYAFDDVSAMPFKVRMPDGAIREFDNHRERCMFLAQWERANG